MAKSGAWVVAKARRVVAAEASANGQPSEQEIGVYSRHLEATNGHFCKVCPARIFYSGKQR